LKSLVGLSPLNAESLRRAKTVAFESDCDQPSVNPGHSAGRKNGKDGMMDATVGQLTIPTAYGKSSEN
jgi:hypothetical protein